MADKPTYEELEQRVKNLEAEVVENKAMKATLNSYQQIILTVSDLMSFLDNNYRYLAVNDAYLDFFPDKYREDIIGHTPSYLIGDKNFFSQIKPHLDRCLEGEVINYQDRFEFPGKGNRVMDISYYPIFTKDGTVSKIVHISRDITKLKQAEEALQKKTHDLGERVKELNCLYGISKIVEQQDISLEEIIQGTVDLIPLSWEYPEITCTRAIIEGREWRTKNYQETIWKQAGDIKVHGKLIGTLEVYYLEEKPEIDEGPFLKEERKLIDAIARLTGRIVERKQAEEEIRLLKEKYEDLYNNAPIMYLSNDTNGIILECNNTVLEKTGYTKKEIIGKHMTQFVTKESSDSFKKDFPELLKTGKILGVERQLVTKNREIIDVILCVTVEYDEHGKPIKTRATFEDITERKLVDKALLESEAQKQAILDASVDRLRYVDKDMKIIWANKATAMELDMSPEDLVGQFCYKLFLDRDTPCKGCPTIKALETGRNELAVIHHPKIKGIEGESYWVIYCVPLKNDTGEIESFIQIARNITEQKEAMQALQDSKETLIAILAASPVGIALTRNRILEWTNSAMCRICGYEEGSLLGKRTEVLYSDAEEYNRVGLEFYSEIEEKGVGQMETRLVAKDGRAIHCYLQGSPIDPSDLSKGVIVAAMDITEHKQAEDRVRNLSQMLMQAQERERQMVSYELHDRIAQNLSILKIGCDTVFDGQSAISSELKGKMVKLSKLTEETIIAVRDLAYDLRPPGLDEMGIVKALEIYCEEFSENSGVEADFQSAGIHKLNLDIDTEIHLYRLVQEGLNNIRKHADAGQMAIKLLGASPNIILRIEDDGNGFDVKARELALDNEKRMGLRSMQERVNLLQGRMTIQSRPAKGTKIFIKFPFKE